MTRTPILCRQLWQVWLPTGQTGVCHYHNDSRYVSFDLGLQYKFLGKVTEASNKKVAVVTGGNKGIGLAITRGLAKTFDGDVYLTAPDEALGKASIKLLDGENFSVAFHRLDIDDTDSINDLANFLKERYSGLDVLVNNAGIAFNYDESEPMADEAQKTIATNYFGVKNTCAKLFPLLRDGARVVNMSSSCGFLQKIPSDELKAKLASSNLSLTAEELSEMMCDYVESVKAGNHKEKGWPNSAYAVSKVGLSALTRIQHREMKKDGSRIDIAINHVHPGHVCTDMTNHKGPLSPDQGAKPPLFAALLPPGTDITGQYIWKDCSIVDWVNGPLPQITSEELSRVQYLV